MKRPPVTSVGAVGVAAGCAGMVAMLPGAAAGVLGAIGISGSSALARTLSPVAEPLFIASAVLVIVGALACGQLVALPAVAGSALLYLWMFQLSSGGSTSGGSMSTMTMQGPHHASLHTEPGASTSASRSCSQRSRSASGVVADERADHCSGCRSH